MTLGNLSRGWFLSICRNGTCGESAFSIGREGVWIRLPYRRNRYFSVEAYWPGC